MKSLLKARPFCQLNPNPGEFDPEKTLFSVDLQKWTHDRRTGFGDGEYLHMLTVDPTVFLTLQDAVPDVGAFLCEVLNEAVAAKLTGGLQFTVPGEVVGMIGQIAALRGVETAEVAKMGFDSCFDPKEVNDGYFGDIADELAGVPIEM